VSRPVTYIVGCGPLGASGYDFIDPARPVILCNAAIKLQDKYNFPYMTWAVSDRNIPRCKWFADAYARRAGSLYPSGQVAEVLDWKGEQFQENPWFTWTDYKLIPGVYRGGASIVGCMMQRCEEQGEDVILTGVDMTGAESLSHEGSPYKPGHWDFKVEVLNHLIAKYMPGTRTLTPTALEVERI